MAALSAVLPTDSTPRMPAVDAGEGGDLRSVAAHDGDGELVQEAVGGFGAVGSGAGSDGIEDDGDAFGIGAASGEEHGLDLLGPEGAEVEHQRIGGGGHVFDLLASMGHHGQGAGAEGDVRGASS